MQYELIYSNRKTISIEVTPRLEVIVRAPRRASRKDIDVFVASKEKWILKAIEKVKERNESRGSENPLSADEIRELAEKALVYIPERVRYYAPIVGVNYGRITIRNQTSRWGSCSAKGNLNFNCMLMLTPPEVIDYVVVHELCHRLQMNHSALFWAEVERVLPDYKDRRKWLKEKAPRLS